MKFKLLYVKVKFKLLYVKVFLIRLGRIKICNEKIILKNLVSKQ